jgi:hypothetical protein
MTHARSHHALGWTIAAAALLGLAGCLGTIQIGPAQPTPQPMATVGLPPGATQGIDRNGSDYRDFDLASPDPMLCLQACVADAPCQAWTYVQPGVQGDAARCWLKNAVPPATPDSCCISGVRVEGGSTLEQ